MITNQAPTITPYALVQIVDMPKSINEVISLQLNTQTIQGIYNNNIRIIENNNSEDDLLDMDDLIICIKEKTIKTKMNITKISKYIPALTIDENDEMED